MTLLESRTWDGKIYSGEWVDGAGGTYAIREPATGAELGHLGLATGSDVDLAARTAREAQRSWAALTHDHRAEVLRRAADLFITHEQEIHEWVIRESGALRSFAERQTRAVAAAECREAAALASTPYGEVLRSTQDRLSFSRHLPVGVVGVIAPFNAPITLAIRSVAPALALGNAVLLKPDPRTSVCGGVVLARVFEEAGLPSGVLHVLPGGGDVGRAIVEHRHVSVIAFTGSTRAGRAVATAAAAHLKRVHLELGGNSAFIVMEDADVETAASAGAFGSFSHAGQICMAAGRHLVHDNVADQYTHALTERANRLTVGDPMLTGTAIGPIIDDRQRDHVHDIVTRSAAAGATVAAGGSYDGLFYRPTVLIDVQEDTPAYQEEVFGPVAPVLTFSTLEEAVALAADSEYGLSLAVMTTDVMKAIRLAERVPSGLVHINDQTVSDEATAPFGGVGDSGTGSRHGGARANLDAFTDLQWVTARDKAPQYPV